MYAETTPKWYTNIKDTQSHFLVLASHLRHLCHLRNLNISRCSVANVGAIALQPHLPYLTVLETLVLNCNGIGDDGAAAISDSIQQCHALCKLELKENFISAAGAKALVEGASWSKNCRDVDMRGNKVKGRFLFGRDPALSAALARAKEQGKLHVQL